MRVLLCLVVLVGGPIYLFNAATRGELDATSALVMVVLFLFAAGGLVAAWKPARK